MAQIDLATLLDETVDRDRLSRVPQIENVLLQASSYDRSASAETLGHAGWFGITDHSQFYEDDSANLPAVRDGERELMQDARAGVVSGIWVTNQPGIVRPDAGGEWL